MAELQHDQAIIEAVNRTIQTESRSEDPYVRRWRPTFGYVVAATWAQQTAALAWAIVVTPEYIAETLDGIAQLSVMWGVALSVLGIGVVKRSHDKEVRNGSREPRKGLLEMFKASKQ